MMCQVLTISDNPLEGNRERQSARDAYRQTADHVSISDTDFAHGSIEHESTIS